MNGSVHGGRDSKGCSPFVSQAELGGLCCRNQAERRRQGGSGTGDGGRGVHMAGLRASCRFPRLPSGVYAQRVAIVLDFISV